MEKIAVRKIFKELAFMTSYSAFLGVTCGLLLGLFIAVFAAVIKIEECYLTNIVNFREFLGCHFETIALAKRVILSGAVALGVVFGAIGLLATAHKLWRVSKLEEDRNEG